jgi:outer membrane protein W
MRTMLKVVAATLLLAAVASAPAKAQGQWFYGLGYQVSIPLSNTKDFTENVSWRGASFEARKAIKPNLTVGLSLGWHVFDEETDEVVSFDNLDVSGDQLRYINSFPILLNAHKYFGQEGSMRPFVGLNAGATSWSTGSRSGWSPSRRRTSTSGSRPSSVSCSRSRATPPST